MDKRDSPAINGAEKPVEQGVIKTISAILISAASLSAPFQNLQPSRSMSYYYATWCGLDKPTALMYEDAIRKYSHKYSVPEKYIERQIFAESRYDYRCISKTGCRGPAQLEPNQYNIKFMKETEEYNASVPVLEQFHYIYPSVEVQCRLWSIYYKCYSNYVRASVAYWAGINSEEMKRYKAGTLNFNEYKYYKIIFTDGYIEEYLICAK
jgi:hypothetical protein